MQNTKPRKLEVHICDACHKKEWRAPHKRQYCDCNPEAPFAMYPLSIIRATNKAMGRFYGSFK
jgi:hypothetical protein